MDKLKLVKTVVFVLTFLLVFGSLALLGTLFKKTRSSSAVIPEAIHLNEPAGSSVRSIKIKDNLLYITAGNGGVGDRIIILDTASGKKISTIHIN